MPALDQPRELLQRFSLGEVDAFKELFRRHQGEVYRWILRIVRDPATIGANGVTWFGVVTLPHLFIAS